MIGERTYKLWDPATEAGFEVEVSMTWEEDRSVGIFGHWEECSAQVEIGPFRILVFFTPEEDRGEPRPVEEWIVEGSDTSYLAGHRCAPTRLMPHRMFPIRHTLSDEDNPENMTVACYDVDDAFLHTERMTLSHLPVIKDAVEKYWEEVKEALDAQDRQADAGVEDYLRASKIWEDRHGGGL